jgi:hypothetical protein
LAGLSSSKNTTAESGEAAKQTNKKPRHSNPFIIVVPSILAYTLSLNLPHGSFYLLLSLQPGRRTHDVAPGLADDVAVRIDCARAAYYYVS